MSRLWSDAVAAAFDDPSLCVKDSTGYSDSTKPAPEPTVAEPSTLNFDFGEPDSALLDDNLELSGGPQNARTEAFSTTIDLCNSGLTCQFKNKRCEDVTLRDCRTGDFVPAKRCVPYTSGQRGCPAATNWDQKTDHALRLNGNGRSSNGLSSVGTKQLTTTTGACLPNRDSRLCEQSRP
jgi:hypothetical protein